MKCSCGSVRLIARLLLFQLFFAARWAKFLTSSSHWAKIGQSWAVPAESGLQLKIHDPARYARGAPRHLQNHQKWFKKVLKNVKFSCVFEEKCSKTNVFQRLLLKMLGKHVVFL